MRSRHRATALVLIFLLVPLLPLATRAQPTEDGRRIDPEAERILRQMGEYLRTAEEFRFQAEVTHERVRSSGQKILHAGRADVALQRPNRLHAHYEGDRRHTRAIFSGDSFTYVDVERNLFAQMETPTSLDAALDEAFDAVGFSVAAADLVSSDPYATLIDRVRSGYVVGRQSVAGLPCHQLAFTQDAIDWQIWIEEGPRPVPRKLVITHKNEFGMPQQSATFVEWDFRPRLSGSYFEFDPPAGSAEIEFLRLEGEEVQR